MRECAKRCEELNTSCPCGDCRLWIDHEEDLRNNLIQIEERRNEYNPMYREILSDLSTKPKSYYMDNLLTSDLLTSDKENVMNNVNRRIINGIPENIHVIFLNSILMKTNILY